MSNDPSFGADTRAIIAACIEVHSLLGPGLLESAYEECLALEMRDRGISFVRQPRLALIYKGRRVEHAYRPDFIVANSVVVEAKAAHGVTSIHRAHVGTTCD